ncbi:MAG: MarR family transcriptional regulator [Pseudomonadota bacterium]
MDQRKFEDEVAAGAKHPPARVIEDLVSFRLQMMVLIGERSARQWMEQMFGLSLNEWRMLALVQSRAPCRAGEISDLLHMDKSQTSRVIKALESRGLMGNQPDPEDGRAVSLHLTEDGAMMLSKMFEEILRSNERILAPLDAEEAQAFHATLGKLINHSQDLLEARLGRPVTR